MALWQKKVRYGCTDVWDNGNMIHHKGMVDAHRFRTCDVCRIEFAKVSRARVGFKNV